MKKILLVGPILTQTGYGEHARMMARALLSRPDLVDLYIHPINWGQSSWLWEDDNERRLIDQLINKTAFARQQRTQFDICLMVTIPNEWEQYRAAPINIGVCAGIETDRVSPEWIIAANKFADSIIVPSEFAKNIFEGTIYNNNGQNLQLQKKIDVVHYPTKKFAAMPELDLGLKNDFNFLVVAQWGPRKNMEGTLAAFYEEFKNDEVGLVLKTSKAKNSLMDKEVVMRALNSVKGAFPDAKCSVNLLHGYLTDQEVNSLYTHSKIKAIVNLGHGEGFGLPLFEAAYSGLPIITHDFGGQKDFLYAPNKAGKTKPMFQKVSYDVGPIAKDVVWDGVLVEGSNWAYVNKLDAKNKMRDTYENYHLAKSKSGKLKTWVLENFKSETLSEQVIGLVCGEASINELSDEDWLESLGIEVHD